jgi:nucleotide-binding universal stress UspA family protein
VQVHRLNRGPRSAKDLDIMLNTILLPLDGSPLAERALTYAALLARRSEARVVLVEAVQAHARPGTDAAESQVEVTSGAEAYLKTASGRLSAAGIVTEAHVYYDDPVHAILDAAARQQADLIVMSTHGRGGLSRMLYGSVADQILRRATVPVLLVPSIVEHAWPTEGPKRMLVPLDGSEFATEALQAAALLTDTRGADLTLLSVVQPVPYPLYGDGYAYVPYDEDAEVSDARQYLEDQATRLREGGHTVTVEVSVGEPSRIIGEIARDRGMDLVVMATHGTGGLGRVILGSVATGTLRHTTAPLLLVRPSAAAQAEPLDNTSSKTASGTGTAQPQAMTLNAGDGEARNVQLSVVELELIERGLRALAYAPGYDYGHIQDARALAERLHRAMQAEAGRPVVSR